MANSSSSKETFLYSDRPRDESGKSDIYWVPLQQPTAALSPAADTAAIAIRRRVCRCPVCQPRLPGLYRASDGSAYPRGARIGKAGEQGDQWRDAPADIKIESARLIDDAMFSKGGPGIRLPIEFTEVKSPKVLTLHCRQELDSVFHRKTFEHFTDQYRFRTDRTDVEVSFFWADKKARVKQWSHSIEIKVVLVFQTEFQAARGDTVRIILERRLDEAGNFHDIACLPQAITFVALSEYPRLARYFGAPDWSVGDLALFIEPSENFAVFRLTKQRRDAIRAWLNKPLVDGIDIGVNSRETALVAALLGLWYLDDKYGDKIDEFFASPVKFIKEKRLERLKEKAKEELSNTVRPYKKALVRTAYGAVLRSMDKETREAWIGLRTESSRIYLRGMAILQLLEKLEKVLPVLMEGFRIYRFVESVLRKDVFYSTKDEYLFISFFLDKDLHVPNGIVCTNLIPIGALAKLFTATNMVENQFLFWESSDAYYLELLDIDRHVRNVISAKAKEETEGKDVCYICKEDEKWTLLSGEERCDSQCSICSQKYHRDCMEFEFGDADCPRCMQRDVVGTM